MLEFLSLPSQAAICTVWYDEKVLCALYFRSTTEDLLSCRHHTWRGRVRYGARPATLECPGEYRERQTLTSKPRSFATTDSHYEGNAPNKNKRKTRHRFG